MDTNKNQEVRQLMIEAAKVQVAALNAGITFWSSWVESASKFAKSLNSELINLGKDTVQSDEAIGKLTDLSREYLRKMTELPGAAVGQFDAEVGKAIEPKKAPSRAARAKE